jgi:hypothetical protein
MHQTNTFGQSDRFLAIKGKRFAGFGSTELTRAGTYVARYHKSSGPHRPAFAFIRTFTALANGMQMMLADGCFTFSKFSPDAIFTFNHSGFLIFQPLCISFF